MRSFTALVNPVSGGGIAPQRWGPLADRLTAAGARVTVERTRSSEHAVGLAAAAAERGDVAVAVGGDGLVRDVAEGVVPGGGTMAVVPAGRGNDLARKLEIPAEPEPLADLLLHAPQRRIDVLDAAGRTVLGNVYAGVDSLAAAMINNSRWLPATVAYRVAPVRAVLKWRAPEYTVIADGEEIVGQADTVVVANSGAYGHGLRIVPDAVLDDGLLDVLIVGAGPKRRIIRFMTEAKTGTHLARPEVRLRTAREVTLRADRDVPVGADGEDFGRLPCTIRLLPSALGIIAP